MAWPGVGVGVIFILGKQNFTKFTITFNINWVLSFIICKVNITIKYQNYIFSKDLDKIVPYSNPIRNKGICKNKTYENPIAQHVNCTEVLSMSINSGKI